MGHLRRRCTRKLRASETRTRPFGLEPALTPEEADRVKADLDEQVHRQRTSAPRDRGRNQRRQGRREAAQRHCDAPAAYRTRSRIAQPQPSLASRSISKSKESAKTTFATPFLRRTDSSRRSRLRSRDARDAGGDVPHFRKLRRRDAPPRIRTSRWRAKWTRRAAMAQRLRAEQPAAEPTPAAKSESPDTIAAEAAKTEAVRPDAAQRLKRSGPSARPRRSTNEAAYADHR